MDDFEENPCEYNPPQADWDDGQANDNPGFYDITWVSFNNEEKHRTEVILTMPQVGTDNPVIWTIQLKVDDEANP